MKIKKFNENNSYTEILRELMIDLHEEIGYIDKSDYDIDFDKKYGIKIKIHIEKSELKTISVYHAQTSIQNIIMTEFKKIFIDMYIEDDKFDQNKIYSILAHELSHYYQALSGEDIYFKSFNQMISIEDFKKGVTKYKNDFLDYIYYNFQHELDARVDQSYEAHLYSKIKNFEDMLNNFYNRELYKMLIFLGNYNSKNMVSRYKSDELLDLTNQFNILYGIEEIKIQQLNDYYKNWEKIFKTNSEEYIEKSKDALRQAFNKERRYEEYVSYCYDERPLNENHDYNMDEEILKLVDMFKQLPL